MPAGWWLNWLERSQKGWGETQYGPHHSHQQKYQLILVKQIKTAKQVKACEARNLRHLLWLRHKHNKLLTKLQILLPGLYIAQVVVDNDQNPPKHSHFKRQPRFRDSHLLKTIKIQPLYYCQLLQDVLRGVVLTDHDRLESREGVPLATDHDGYQQYLVRHQRTIYGCFYLYE